MKLGDYIDAWLDYGWPPGIIGSAIYRWWRRRRYRKTP